MNTSSFDTCDLAIVVTQAPRRGYLGQEVFDMAVACGVFDQSVTVVFMDAGCFHLAADQPAAPGRKTLSKLWQSAGLFGVDRVVARKGSEAMIEQLSRSPALSDLELLDDTAIGQLLQNAEQVVIL